MDFVEHDHSAAATRDRLFVAPSVFRLVLARFDIGAGDRFYDDSRAYDRPWGEALLYVRRTLFVTAASRGEYGYVRYQISRWDGVSWIHEAEQATTQGEFRQLLHLLP